MIWLEPDRQDRDVKVEMFNAGWLTAAAGVWRRGDDLDRAIRFPVPVYVAESADHRVLIDTGLHPGAASDARAHYGRPEVCSCSGASGKRGMIQRPSPAADTSRSITTNPLLVIRALRFLEDLDHERFCPRWRSFGASASILVLLTTKWASAASRGAGCRTPRTWRGRTRRPGRTSPQRRLRSRLPARLGWGFW